MYDKQRVITLALSQVGYREKASNANLDDPTANAGSGNYTKYARDLDAIKGFYNGPKQGYAYCDVFVDWCFVKAFGVVGAKELLCQPDNSCGAGCYYSAWYFEQHKQFHERDPQAGDQIFFSYREGEVSHTGLVVEVTSSSVFTVEGNTSDGVYKRSYPLSDARIYGYGRPNWNATPSEQADPEPAQDATPAPTPIDTSTIPPVCTITIPMVRPGDVGEAVKAAQILLIGRGFSCGIWGADGDYGSATRGAVERFQRKYSLEVDGIIGKESWLKLIKGVS